MESIPAEVRKAMRRNQGLGASSPTSRLHVETGGRCIEIRRSWETGFSIDTGAGDYHLPGLVNVYEGPRLLTRCLIVTSHEEDGETVYEIKRATLPTDSPPVDFEREA